MIFLICHLQSVDNQDMHWEKEESQNVWSSVTQLSKKMALLYKRESIFKITLQESHFGSLFFLSVLYKPYVSQLKNYRNVKKILTLLD